MTLLVGAALKKPPTVEVLPPDGVDYSAGDEAVLIAELGGLTLDDWQEHVLRNALALREDGRFAAFEVGLIVGRQNGKSEILIAVILWALYTERFDLPQVIFAAHEYKTAKKIFKRLAYLLDPPRNADPLSHASPELLRLVKKVIHSHGEEGVELHNGRQVSFVARTKGSGRGFTGDLVLLDEAYALNAEQVSALMYTMGARPNTQIWYSASGPFEDSEKQLEVMARAESDDPGSFAYFGWQVPQGEESTNPEWWVRVTPAHPHRTSDETLRNEFRADSEGFAREKLCMRVAKNPVFSLADWRACTSDSTEADPDVYVLEARGDRSSACVFRADSHGRVELVAQRKDVSGLLEDVADKVPSGARIVVDANGPTAGVAEELDRAVETVTTAEIKKACGRFYDAVSDHKVSVRLDNRLDRAVIAGKRKTDSDSWVFSREPEGGELLLAMSIGYAAAVKDTKKEPLAVWV